MNNENMYFCELNYQQQKNGAHHTHSKRPWRLRDEAIFG